MKKLLFIIIGYSLLLAGCGENEAIYYEGESDSTSGIAYLYNMKKNFPPACRRDETDS